jgi:hypothetical protein
MDLMKGQKDLAEEAVRRLLTDLGAQLAVKPRTARFVAL